jgi:protein dpy-30
MTESQQAPINDDANAGDILLQDPSSSSVYTTGSGPPQLPSHILQIIDHELASSNTPSLSDIQAYPTAAYFNKTVIPIIIEGLSIVAKERPKNPIEYLAAFFIKNRERFGESV